MKDEVLCQNVTFLPFFSVVMGSNPGFHKLTGNHSTTELYYYVLSWGSTGSYYIVHV